MKLSEKHKTVMVVLEVSSIKRCPLLLKWHW